MPNLRERVMALPGPQFHHAVIALAAVVERCQQESWINSADLLIMIETEMNRVDVEKTKTELIDTLEDVLIQATQQEDTLIVDDPTQPTGKRIEHTNRRMSHDFLSAYENAFELLVQMGRARYMPNGIDIRLISDE